MTCPSVWMAFAAFLFCRELWLESMTRTTALSPLPWTRRLSIFRVRSPFSCSSRAFVLSFSSLIFCSLAPPAVMLLTSVYSAAISRMLTCARSVCLARSLSLSLSLSLSISISLYSSSLLSSFHSVYFCSCLLILPHMLFLILILKRIMTLVTFSILMQTRPTRISCCADNLNTALGLVHLSGLSLADHWLGRSADFIVLWIEIRGSRIFSRICVEFLLGISSELEELFEKRSRTDSLTAELRKAAGCWAPGF